MNIKVNNSIKSVQIYAHRGGAGLQPENTLEAFKSAIELGVDFLDLDVALTQDGIVIAYHDRTLNPNITRNSQKEWIGGDADYIYQHDYADLRTYNVGKINPDSQYAKKFPKQQPNDESYIPTLREIIQLIKSMNANQVKLQVEIKSVPNSKNNAPPEEFIPAIVSVLKCEDFIRRVEIHSFDWNQIKYLMQYAPKIKASLITALDAEEKPTNSDEELITWYAGLNPKNFNSTPEMVADAGAKVWCPYFKDVTKSEVEKAHALKLKVVPWTADKANEMNTLIAAGVNGIITNRPDTLRELLQEMGYPVVKQFV